MAEIELHFLNHQCLTKLIFDQAKFNYKVEVKKQDWGFKESIINGQFENENAKFKLKRLYKWLDG